MEGKVSSIASIAELRWQCRRGMLELDLLLMPFLEREYGTLLPQDQTTFVELLSYPDQTLYAWFLDPEQCEREEMRGIIHKIRLKPRLELGQ